MSRPADRILYQLQRLGRVGAMGALLLAAALVMDLARLQPLRADLGALREANEMAAVAEPAETAAARIQASTLPVASAAEESLRQLFAAAAKSGLTLDQGDYTLSSEKSGDIHRYQISLPVYGSYPAVRGFIAHALNENPALALAHVEMGREAIEETRLVTTLRFTLFLKEAK
jgi:hypothetical protein